MEEPINYPFLAGLLEGFISRIPFMELPKDPYKCCEYLVEEMSKIRQRERDYSGVKVN